VRQLAPDEWFLAPGLGAQGADLAEAMQAGLRADGLGLLINVSRGISRADDPGGAARALVESFRQGGQEAQQPFSPNRNEIPWVGRPAGGGLALDGLHPVW
jgi:hypothetical protein